MKKMDKFCAHRALCFILLCSSGLMGCPSPEEDLEDATDASMDLQEMDASKDLTEDAGVDDGPDRRDLVDDLSSLPEEMDGFVDQDVEDMDDLDLDEQDMAPACERGETGWFPENIILQGISKTRQFALYVPESIPQDCRQTVPVLLDFHGASGGPDPELAFQLEGARALADAHGVILVRPRGTPRASDPQVFVWEDPTSDRKFVSAILTKLEERGHTISASETFAIGFSNGTYMTSWILQEQDPRFAGVASIGGGFPVSSKPYGQSDHRVYLSTGYRDAYGPETDNIARQTPPELLYVSEHAGSHNLRPFHYEEAWKHWHEEFLVNAQPLSPWIQKNAPMNRTSALATHQLGGKRIVLGARGASFDDAGNEVTITSPDRHLVSSCTFVDGGTEKLFLADGTDIYLGDDPGRMVRKVGVAGLSYPYAVACHDDRIAVQGYEGLWVSRDGGASFTRDVQLSPYIFALSADYSDTGTYIAAGSYLAAIRISNTGRESFPQIPTTIDFVNDLHVVEYLGQNQWIMAGTSSIFLRSIDDGQSFQQSQLPIDMDIYAVAHGEGYVVAVGDHGKVLVSDDQGISWTDRSIATERYLGAAFIENGELTVYGQGGFIATLALTSSP